MVSEISGFDGDDSIIYMPDDMGQGHSVIKVTRLGVDEDNALCECGTLFCYGCYDVNDDAKLIRCHRCEAYGHRKCYGIGDNENIPIFLCPDCSSLHS